MLKANWLLFCGITKNKFKKNFYSYLNNSDVLNNYYINNKDNNNKIKILYWIVSLGLENFYSNK